MTLHDLFDCLGALCIIIVFFKVIPEALVCKICRLHMLWKKMREEKIRRTWEKIPDCGSTVEGGLLAAKSIIDGLVTSDFKGKMNRGEFERDY